MIRKVFLFIIASAIILWLIGAYYVKSRFITSLTEAKDDNIEFSYQRANIGGFPFSWKITLVEPKLTVTNHVAFQEFSAEEAGLYFDYNLKNVRINLPKSLNYSFSKLDNKYDYTLISNRPIKLDLSFIESLYNIENSFWEKNYFKSLDLKLPRTKAVLNNQDIFHLDSYELSFARDISDHIDVNKIHLNTDYKSDVNYLKINSAHLQMNLDYIVNRQDIDNKKDEGFDHKININQLFFKFDNASVNLLGDIKLSKIKIPNGNLKLEIERHNEVIDTLFPENFLFSKSYIKKIVAKASMNNANKQALMLDKIALDISFSENGISVGSVDISNQNTK